eukprot:m.144175 g.144175  ORF g.144175 m.144175 type:complete len:689 (+) comp14911_c0_seq5:163-2229(+)
MVAFKVGTVLLLLLLCTCMCTSTADLRTYDVLVYSANSAGVGAAVAASSNGKYRVAVMEPLKMIGGMGAAGGVALMNQGCGLAGVTGLAKNWSLLCGQYYYGTPRMVTFPSMNVSAYAFWQLLNSSGSVDTSVGCRAVNVTKDGSCLTKVDFLCDDDNQLVTIQAKYMIDASYDGDLMTMAGGIDYTSGRESREVFNESLAGVSLLPWNLENFAAANLSINPYFPNGTLLKYIDEDPLQPVGTGDDKVMAFQYFPCLSPTDGNKVPFYPPPGYNPDDFTLLLRQIQGLVANGKYPDGPPLGYFGGIQCYDNIVEQVTGNRDCLFCCGTGPVDADQPNLNHGWANANYTRKQEIEQQHRYYLQGSLYFMANDPRVPNGTRQSAQGYGYCKDEYKDFGNWPPQLYVRISNRLQGMSTLTQNNIVNPRVKPDGVSMGCWEFDQHTESRHVIVDPKDPTNKTKILTNEGFFRASLGTESLHCEDPRADCTSGGNWYDVPFGVMVPKRGQASNLLIPVVISASSVAYASTRIENMFMDLGTAAGVAVVQLMEKASQTSSNDSGCGLAVQDTNITAVQDVLVNVYGQRVHGPPTPQPSPSHEHGYTVVGAGSDVWNGNYSFTRMYTDERPIFEKDEDSTRKLYSWNHTWRLAIEGHEIFYVSPQTPDDNPPLNGWKVANGTAPAPSLIMRNGTQ